MINKEKIREVLNREKNISFAYLYGSFVSTNSFRDIDIAIYLKRKIPFKSIANLEIKLSENLNLSPDVFDVKVLNGILESPDAFSLLYLERLFKEGELIVNKDFEILTDFIEKFSNKYREAEFILSEIK
jgi:predicted nucleotidyltransferase